MTYDVQQMKVLMTLVLVLLLAGCAAGGGDGAGSTNVEEETTARSAREETTVLKAEDNLRRPPDSTLSYGGQEVKGTLGSYCWTFGSSGMCSDAPPIKPPRKKTLTVPSGSEMVFRYGGQRSPDTVDAGAFPLDKKGRLTASALRNGSRSLKAHGSGVERTIPVELPQGEYVVDVFITVQYSDASYYFRVMVE
jgi:hypothetical protein